MKKLFCLVMVLVCLLAGCGGMAETTEPVKGNAPDFTVQDPEGKEVKLSDYLGKPVVVNLWATWCNPCKAELPHFELAYKSYPQVQFMMVDLTVSDSMQQARDFISQQGYTFPVFFDVTGSVAMAYNASAIPVTVFINAAGDVVAQKVGMLSEEELVENIQKILE